MRAGRKQDYEREKNSGKGWKSKEGRALGIWRNGVKGRERRQKSEKEGEEKGFKKSEITPRSPEKKEKKVKKELMEIMGMMGRWRMNERIEGRNKTIKDRVRGSGERTGEKFERGNRGGKKGI